MTAAHSELLAAFTRGDRHLPINEPLELLFDDAPATLAIDAVLRLLPRKRVVLSGYLGDQAVIVKWFARSRSSDRNIRREIDGHRAVVAADVACPQLLGRCRSHCGRFDGVVYEWLQHAAELAALWPQFDATQKQQWLAAIVHTTLQLHLHGALQSDIHLGNFLCRDNQLYVLDLGSIITARAPLTRRASLRNLGQLAAQLDVAEQPLLDAALADYAAQRNWPLAALQHELQRHTRRAWRKRLSDYLQKSQRNCSLTAYQARWNRVWAYRRSWHGGELQQFADDPDAFMQRGQLLKSGNTATVVKTVIDGQPVVIKRYNIKNWRHALSRSVRTTRAAHSWRIAHLLELIGIDSLKPIALLERRCGPLRSTAYFVSSCIDAQDLLTIGQQRALSADESASLQKLLQQMRTCRLSHGDFKANNLLVDRGRIEVIDLDALQRHCSDSAFERAFDKDMRRLLANWPATNAVHRQIVELQTAVADKLRTRFYL